MRQGRKTIAGVIELGQQRGEVRPELNKDKVAVQLVQAVMGTVLLWSLHEKPSLAKWMENSFEHAWRAIAASGKE